MEGAHGEGCRLLRGGRGGAVRGDSRAPPCLRRERQGPPRVPRVHLLASPGTRRVGEAGSRRTLDEGLTVALTVGNGFERLPGLLASPDLVGGETDGPGGQDNQLWRES